MWNQTYFLCLLTIAVVYGEVTPSGPRVGGPDTRLGGFCAINDECEVIDPNSECSKHVCQCKQWFIQSTYTCSPMPWITLIFGAIFFTLLSVVIVPAVTHACIRRKQMAKQKERPSLRTGGALAVHETGNEYAVTELQDMFNHASHPHEYATPTTGEEVAIRLGSLIV